VDRERLSQEAREMIRREGIESPDVIVSRLGLDGLEQKERRLWLLLLGAFIFSLRDEFRRAAALARRLISLTGDPWFLKRAYFYLASATQGMGDPLKAEKLYLKAVELGFDPVQVCARMALCRIFAEDYARATELLEGAEPLMETLYPQCILLLLSGDLRATRARLSQLFTFDPSYGGAWELVGFLERIAGRFRAAGEAFLKAAGYFAALKNNYSIFPVNKHRELSLLASIPPLPDDLEKEALRLARKGGPAEKAALMEHEALKRWEAGDLIGAGEMSLEAGEALALAAQTSEAFFAHIRSAYLGYLARTDTFMRSIDYIRPRMGLYPVIEQDPFYGQFTKGVLRPLVEFGSAAPASLRVSLFGDPEPGDLRNPSAWSSRKALSLFKYLLLNYGRFISSDYLAYLLWPREGGEKLCVRLRNLIYMIRNNLGPMRNILIRSKASYAIKEDTRLWIDAHEFQNLVREAEALDQNPTLQMKKYLKALDLYRGKLLPEDPYDRFIEEHRNHLHNRFQKALEKVAKLLVEVGRAEEALGLAERFYQMFPKDDLVTKTYTNVLVKLGRNSEAKNIYDEFRRKLWREHRLKPSFDLK